ncbi:MAG: metallophosphatase family protein [candidate division WOR-3 bacterium]|nr:metallophosphatase family protein [candidate division WOR-3 bacterium]MCX7948225.1 metallophosphatase family protein [candidate division WOR-3 bacterium]MDW8150027.1 metallophosphoesterase family protein [candidate division WOR-3 bacterium]
MKIAILSDIHGNLEAFESVLNEVYKRKVDKIICLGDLIDYGPNPNEVVEIAKREFDIIVMGNHDYAVVDRSIIKHFAVVARSSILWTLDVLTDENKLFISSLKLEENFKDIYIVHACPKFMLDWTYILSIDEAKIYFEYTDSFITLIGHTHIPAIFKKVFSNIEHIVPKEGVKYKLERDAMYFLNPGSVGQPRDGDYRASFGILNLDELTFEIHRVDYDVKKTIKKILNCDLPQILAYRLENGL